MEKMLENVNNKVLEKLKKHFGPFTQIFEEKMWAIDE